jgi:hypothetical protein
MVCGYGTTVGTRRYPNRSTLMSIGWKEVAVIVVAVIAVVFIVRMRTPS